LQSSRVWDSPEPMAASSKRASKKPASQDSSRAEQSVQAFRDALEKSVTISRDRLQEVIDDAVKRGRMTRGDAEEMVSRLVTRGRDQADDLISQLERLLAQLREAPDRARRKVDRRTQSARQQVGNRAEKARKRAVKAADTPLAQADRVRRTARVPGFPITAYDELSVRQIDRRLQEMNRAELRRVRDYERRNKARKGVLQAVDRKLQD
jgi:polyhydroxyalkanoate synthesis regulator phasin